MLTFINAFQMKSGCIYGVRLNIAVLQMETL
jgi:hypothetical protein